MEKYGFVYIWFDIFRKMYYVGCHWGREDDGYICSSNWMRNTYRRRPNDFKRRIIKRVYTTRQDLFTEEQRYLNMVKPEEVRIRYFNLHVTVGHWSSDPDKLLTVGEKISKANKGKTKPPRSKEHQEKLANSLIGKPRSEETKEKLSIANKGISPPNKGISMSEEQKIKLSLSHTGNVAWNKNKTLSEEHKNKISISSKNRMKGRKHWNNGIINKCCCECPGEGWVIGLINNMMPVTWQNIREKDA